MIHILGNWIRKSTLNVVKIKSRQRNIEKKKWLLYITLKERKILNHEMKMDRPLSVILYTNNNSSRDY